MTHVDVNLWEKISDGFIEFIIWWKKNRHSWRLNNSSKTFSNQWYSQNTREKTWGKFPLGRSATSVRHGTTDRYITSTWTIFILHLHFIATHCIYVPRCTSPGLIENKWLAIWIYRQFVPITVRQQNRQDNLTTEKGRKSKVKIIANIAN